MFSNWIIKGEEKMHDEMNHEERESMTTDWLNDLFAKAKIKEKRGRLTEDEKRELIGLNGLDSISRAVYWGA